MNPHISIVIPVYKENKYLERTLKELYKQSVISDSEIIIANYDPTRENPIPVSNSYRLLQVDRKGIAYARHKGIEISQGDVIVNFDADARYDSNDGLRYMTEPILERRCVLTCCDNIFDLTDLSQKELDAMRVPIVAANTLCIMQRTTHLACLEPGSAMSCKAYYAVGGFNDIMQHELWHLSNRIILKYLPFNIMHIPQTAVYVSARRAKKFSDLGIGVLDYSNKAFR